MPLITEENKENIKSEIFSLQDAEKMEKHETLEYTDSETSYLSGSGYTEDEEDEEDKSVNMSGTSSEDEEPLNRSEIFPVDCGIPELIDTSEASEIVENLQVNFYIFLLLKFY